MQIASPAIGHQSATTAALPNRPSVINDRQRIALRTRAGPCSVIHYPGGITEICYCNAANQCDDCVFQPS
jgi:hypothetical protein